MKSKINKVIRVVLIITAFVCVIEGSYANKEDPSLSEGMELSSENQKTYHPKKDGSDFMPEVESIRLDYRLDPTDDSKGEKFFRVGLSIYLRGSDVRQAVVDILVPNNHGHVICIDENEFSDSVLDKLRYFEQRSVGQRSVLIGETIRRSHIQRILETPESTYTFFQLNANVEVVQVRPTNMRTPIVSVTDFFSRLLYPEQLLNFHVNPRLYHSGSIGFGFALSLGGRSTGHLYLDDSGHLSWIDSNLQDEGGEGEGSQNALSNPATQDNECSDDCTGGASAPLCRE